MIPRTSRTLIVAVAVKLSGPDTWTYNTLIDRREGLQPPWKKDKPEIQNFKKAISHEEENGKRRGGTTVLVAEKTPCSTLHGVSVSDIPLGTKKFQLDSTTSSTEER
jgi:hypothetical protein